MAASQNGFPASENRADIGVKTFAVPGRPDILLPIRADVAPLFLEMGRWWNTWEPLLNPGCWGWAYRPIRGQTSGLSNHASGTAVDFNAPLHNLGAVGTLGRYRDAVVEKARSLGLRSGTEYTGRRDEMHIELNVPLDQALALVKRLQTPPASSPPTSGAPAGGHPTLQKGSTGDEVKLLQRWFGLTADGVFGPLTDAKVRWYQQMKGLTVDGVAGAATWGAMGL